VGTALNAAKSLPATVDWAKGLPLPGDLKSKFDAYGVAVRAGAITPSEADEYAFRKEAGLPDPSPAVKQAWKEDKGIRRPITLAQKAANALGIGKPTNPERDNDDESNDD
jgi:hypothetical protein